MPGKGFDKKEDSPLFTLEQTGLALRIFVTFFDDTSDKLFLPSQLGIFFCSLTTQTVGQNFLLLISIGQNRFFTPFISSDRREALPIQPSPDRIWNGNPADQ